MQPKLFIPAILFFFVLFSCNTKTNDSAAKDLTLENPQAQEPQTSGSNNQKQIPIGTSSQLKTDSSVNQNPLKATASIDWDKKIIKTATLKVEVKDFKNYNETVHNTVRKYGGYIAQEQQNLSEEKSETVISIKVPVAQFEAMMNELPGSDGKVLERKINTDDVTGQMIDTKSRLESKKEMRLKYLEFLRQSKNIEEVLKVQSEVNSIQEEIEAAASRVAYLSHESSLSTINLTYFQPIAGYKPTDADPSFFGRAAEAFKSGASWILNLLVGLISIWPFLLLIAGSFFVWKKVFSVKKLQHSK